MSKLLKLGLVLVLTLAATPAMALTYETIVNWVDANGTGTSANLYSAIADGDTAYCVLAMGTPSSPRITRVDGLLSQPVGSRTTTDLVSTSTWTTASGGTGITAFYGFSISGGFLQFSESSSDAVWRVNRTTGALTPYVTKAQIQAFTGGTNVNLGTGNDTAPDGEFAFYDSTTKRILKTTGAGTVATFVTTAQLTNLNGADIACASMTFDPSGNMYWTNSTTDDIYMRDTAGNTSLLLDGVFIQAVGGSSVTFRDIFYAPDGYAYFFESGSSHILRFDPDDAISTLEIYLSKTEIENGPAVTPGGIYQLSWYDGRLAFNVQSSTGARGLYAVVPEPMTAGLLLLGLPLLRRRSR